MIRVYKQTKSGVGVGMPLWFGALAYFFAFMIQFAIWIIVCLVVGAVLLTGFLTYSGASIGCSINTWSAKRKGVEPQLANLLKTKQRGKEIMQSAYKMFYQAALWAEGKR